MYCSKKTLGMLEPFLCPYKPWLAFSGSGASTSHFYHLPWRDNILQLVNTLVCTIFLILTWNMSQLPAVPLNLLSSLIGNSLQVLCLISVLWPKISPIKVTSCNFLSNIILSASWKTYSLLSSNAEEWKLRNF